MIFSPKDSTDDKQKCSEEPQFQELTKKQTLLPIDLRKYSIISDHPNTVPSPMKKSRRRSSQLSGL